VTVSSNKLLGLGKNNPTSVFFSGADGVLERRITSRTCVLLISQSGQTFPTLHATRNLSDIVADRLWILTGEFLMIYICNFHVLSNLLLIYY
jgi:glucosamine 6-phosphate synthetase-like amidotransferase/phosphosugar isomerase protein